MQLFSRRPAVLAAISISAMCACGGRHESTELYVLVTANTRIAYWQEAAQGLRAASQDLGVKWEVAGPETYDPKAQKDAFQNLLHRPVAPDYQWAMA